MPAHFQNVDKHKNKSFLEGGGAHGIYFLPRLRTMAVVRGGCIAGSSIMRMVYYLCLGGEKRGQVELTLPYLFYIL